MKFIPVGPDAWALERTDSDRIDAFLHALDLFESDKPAQAEVALKRILDANPNHMDALFCLSMVYEETNRPLEAYLACREVVRLGLNLLPAKFDWKKSLLEWGFHENRMFLRAYLQLAMWMEDREDWKEAIQIYTNLLAVSPMDNLGVRHQLPRLWLHTGNLTALLRHCKAQADDASPEITYTYPLALILKGDLEKAKPLLADARQRLPLVAKELLKKRHTRPKSFMPGYITHGGADQAYVYWQDYGAFWMDSETAMAMLAA